MDMEIYKSENKGKALRENRKMATLRIFPRVFSNFSSDKEFFFIKKTNYYWKHIGNIILHFYSSLLE